MLFVKPLCILKARNDKRKAAHRGSYTQLERADKAKLSDGDDNSPYRDNEDKTLLPAINDSILDDE